jgi:hypothetical protein
MEPEAPIPLPFVIDAAEEAARIELDAAIALVSSGAASRVRVAGLAIAVADRVAGTGAAHAGTAGLRFGMQRSGDRATFTVGPRD